MPSVSKAQQKAAAMAEHMSPDQAASAGPAVQQMSKMSHGQLHEFASGSMKGKPEHKHKHHKSMHGRSTSNEMGRRRNPRGGM